MLNSNWKKKVFFTVSPARANLDDSPFPLPPPPSWPIKPLSNNNTTGLLTYIHTVQKLQNRVARIITHSNYDTRSKDILNNLGWKDLAERRRHQLATIMFKTMNGQVPQYISQLFTKTSDIHAYSLRRSGDSLFIPRPNTEALKKSFSYRGAILWNSLSSDKCNATSIAQFTNYL